MGIASSAGGGFNIKNAAVQGGVGLAGAIGVNLLVNKVASFLPASMSSGIGRAATKAAIGLGLGYAAKKMGQGRYATALAAGGILVAGLDIWMNKFQNAGLKGISYGGDNIQLGAASFAYPLADGSVVDGAGNLIAPARPAYVA